MHDVTTSRPEPIRDSEGLLVTGLPRVYTLTCGGCGWATTTDDAAAAIALAQEHEAQP